MAGTIKNWILVAGVVCIFFVTFSHGIFLFSDPCGPLQFQCDCGRKLTVSKLLFHKCKILFSCKFCTSVFNKSKNDICAKFSGCSECSSYGDECFTCLKGKFGTWCEMDCQCKNDADCDRNGRCICPKGYKGVKCEITEVNNCKELPVPTGGFINYLPPLNTRAARKANTAKTSTARSRKSRLPSRLAAELPPNHKSVEITELRPTHMLPPGHHQIGSRAEYNCDSRYYDLEGSKIRHCQKDGTWSGRPASCIPICGRSNSPRTPFIVNGNASTIGQWPWQVGISRLLQNSEKWLLSCGGALLTEQWIVTAAHCVTYSETTIIVSVEKFRIYLGKHYRENNKDDEFVQRRKVREIHVHPDYDPHTLDADIALIQLDAPVQLTSRVQPVCLPSEQTAEENLLEGKEGIVSGWGKNEKGKYSKILRQTMLRVVSDRKCEKGYEESFLSIFLTDNMFCAGYDYGKYDACRGDSGGPIVFIGNYSRKTRWIMEGIVSWGSPDGCGLPKQYGVFTKISRFLDWMHQYF